MIVDPEAQSSGLHLEVRGFLGWLVFALFLAIPVVAIVLITRIARRNPSRFRRQLGHRRLGDRLFRVGVVVAGLGVLAAVTGIVVDLVNPGVSDDAAEIAAVLGILVALIGGVITGIGGAIAVRAGWVGLATMAAADVWIFYGMVIVSIEEPDAVQGLLLLAFAIHSICSLVAARWSFRARHLGAIERAKAGEAGRTVGAVWVFLVAYSTLTMLREESGIFDSTAGSAVTAALTLGALAATMGSGFTKYTEAMNAPLPAELVEVEYAAESPADRDANEG